MKSQVSRLMFLTLLLCAIASAQQLQFEYGKPAEMRGMTHFFLETQGDLKRHGQIVEFLQKKLPSISFTDRAEDAQALIIYSEDEKLGLVDGTSVKLITCNAYVGVPLDSGKARVLFSYKKKKGLFEHEPYKNFADEFVKAYKDANTGLPKSP